METLATVLTILCIIFLVLQIIFFVILLVTGDESFVAPMWIMCLCFWICMFDNSICKHQIKKNKEAEIVATQPVEYPAADYTLDYKVTEFQGKTDTTYVITPKDIKDIK